MKTIHHVFDVAASPEAVYDALTTQKGLSGWWTTRVETSGELGSIVDFTFVEGFNPDMQISDLQPGKRVAWTCVGGHEPWADNTFAFEIEGGGDPSGEQTRVRFWQHYATELDDDSYGIYNYNWAYYLESLRLLLTDGAGKPY